MNPLLFLKFFNFHDSSRIDTGAQTSQAARQVHCSRTDGVRPRALGQGSNRVPLGDITNTQNRKTGSNKRSRELEGGDYCMTTCPCP